MADEPKAETKGDSSPAGVPAAGQALEPAAPVLPAEVVGALQEGRYADAIAALDRLAGAPDAKADLKSYAALLKGIALRNLGRLDDARAALDAAIKAEPKGRWAAKLRAEQAAVELAAGRFAEAEALAHAEAESLLAPDRKDRLAEIYKAFGEKLQKPDAPTVAADPEGAHALFEQARLLAKGVRMRASLLLAMARASQAAGNPGRAIEEFQAYLNEYGKAEGDEKPDAVDLDAARFGLGESQLAAGQPLPARLTWETLIREPRAGKQAEYHARAMYELSRTYGIPNPANPTDQNLGVAALKRFLEAYPAHPKAVRAAFEIGQSYQADNVRRAEDALAAFRAFLKGEGFRAESDAARRERVELAMEASYRIGSILLEQGRHDDAIAAFQGYLAQYPNGPHSAAAQRSILDARLRIADAHERDGRFEDARTAWTNFVSENPLDERVPELLYRIGASFLAEEPKKVDEAIAAWETLIGKFPQTVPAGHAQFDTAKLFEETKGDPATAIERYRKIEVEPWKSQAQQRVAVMESKALTVVTPRAFRTGETPHLTITTRNLEKLTFSAYKLDPEAYFRKKHTLSGVESLDIGLVAPDAEWSEPVPGYGKYKPIEAKFDLKVEIPGVYVVKVSDEKTLQATTLVLGSDVEAIVKHSRDQLLVYAQDMKTGLGRANARVLVSNGSDVLLDGKTGEDGVLLTTWKEPIESPGTTLHYLVLDAGHAAGRDLATAATVSEGLSARAYLYTDRPAYRPGQAVQLRGVVREIADGQYAVRAGDPYKLEVLDSRGRPFVARSVKLSEFGTFAESIALDPAAPIGDYRVRLYQPGKSEFGGGFQVRAYQLQKVDLEFDLPRTVYYRGEKVEGSVVAKYQYGTPLAGRSIQVVLPDGRTLSGKTDDAGRYAFSFGTEGFGETQALQLAAQLPEDGVAAGAQVMVAAQGFTIDLSTTRDVYLDGESFPLEITTRDALGEPIGQELSVAVLKLVPKTVAVTNTEGQAVASVMTEREVSRQTIRTDDKTGRAQATLKVDDKAGGSFIVRAAGTDRFGNPIVADHTLTISGQEDEDKLRILADRQRFKVGEEAAIRLFSRRPAGQALLTWEADRILTYKLVSLKEGDNPVTWAVEGNQFPNFRLTAARMAGTKFDEASLDVEVERELRVTLRPTKESVGPGEEVEVEVTTADQLGRPVPAELSLALVDRALLRLFQDAMPPIHSFFYDQTRTGAFATESTNTFEYRPATVPVPQAVVEEADRAAALATNLARRAGAVQDAQSQVMLGLPAMEAAQAPAPAAPEAAPAADDFSRSFGIEGQNWAARAGRDSGMGGMMGGMGGGMMGRPMRGAVDEKSLAEMEVLSTRSAGDVAAYYDAELKDGTVVYRKRKLGEAQPRQSFVETAYWNPRVVTGADGKAKVTFTAPMALSRYEFSTRGVTGADTLVGQTTADLAVRKDFFVDLKVPASLTQGDRPRFAGRLHHTGVSGAAQLTLKVYAAGREQSYPRTVELKGDGVEEIAFDPFEIPDADDVRLTLTAKAGEASDELVVEVPVRPWGLQAFASASGTSSSSTTALVALPQGRAYEDPELLIVLSPTMRRMLVELALGREVIPFNARQRICFPLPPQTIADRASDLLAAGAVLANLRGVKAGDAPEAVRLADRVRGIAAELVTLQNEDGGWPWVATEAAKGQAPASDAMSSARASWALATAESLALLPDPASLDRAVNYLNQQYAKTEAADTAGRAALLHALSTRRKATFEAANALNRDRQSLPDAALAFLALSFANQDRTPLANEVLGVLGPRAKTEKVGPGQPARIYWEGASRHPGHRGAVEATALAAMAYSRVRPDAPELRGAVEWLLAHRVGDGWRPHLSQGPAVTALATYYGRAESAEDRYRLVVTVNDKKVHEAEIIGHPEGKAIAVPRDALQPGGDNRVRFEIDGRRTFGYAVTLTGFTRDFGPDQSRQDRTAIIDKRIYTPGDPEFEGRPLATGFGVAVGAQYFENALTQVPQGGRARIKIDAYRVRRQGQPAWEQEFLILEEHLPAGATLVDGSIQTSAVHHTLDDGELTLYFAPDQEPGRIQYDVFGYLPGQYRALPPEIRSAYEPGRRHVGPAGELRVLPPGEKSTDPYKPTPDELYARGKALFDAGRLADAAEPLGALWTSYTLQDETSKDVARMLLLVHIEKYDPRQVVQFFEVLKEKYPELVLTFDKIQVVGRAYRDIGEFERAFLVWRTLVDASYLEDARLGETLRQRGKPLEALALLLELWRQYPGTAAIDSDFFGLAQLLAKQAGDAITDPVLRQALAQAGKSRSDLLLQSIRLIQVYLSLAPKSAVADEASLALLGNFLELGDYKAVVQLAARFAKLYPKSTFQDSFQYSEALARFHLGEYDRAVEVAEAIAAATYKDADGVDQPSPNKWQALYIIGQIFDARRQPSKAVEYYRKVAEQFTDAAESVAALTRKALTLPEVSVLRPPGAPKVAAAEGGLRAVPPEAPRRADTDDDRKPVALKSRNIHEAAITVYPVDLMRLYLTRRNLDGIAGIDLAGITPLHESTVKLGDGIELDDHVEELELPLEREGAYLVMVRGDNLYASGITLVTPLELEVVEEGGTGRVRVRVRDAASGDPVPGVQVKVIGTQNPTFLSGTTDLRGVYVAEGVLGQVTAVARREPVGEKAGPAYAFYRGTSFVGTPPPPTDAGAAANAPAESAGEEPSLEQNLKMQNSSNQLRQIERLEQRYNAPAPGGVNIQGFK